MNQSIILTKKAKDFIIQKCLLNKEIFSKTTKFALPKSNVVAGKTFNALIFDDNNKQITDVSDYANQIIKWFNYFGDLFQVDPNICAAQCFLESAYSPLSFTERNTFGISGINDYELFNIIFSSNSKISSDDITNISKNINGDPYQIKTLIPYIKNNGNGADSTEKESLNAVNNREFLYQNISNNPKLIILCQFFLLSEYGIKNNNVASSALLSYYMRSNDTSKNYSQLLDVIKKKYDSSQIETPKKYVNDIFSLLYNFGYNINFDSALVPYTSQPDNPKNNEILNSITTDQLKNSLQFIPKKNLQIYTDTFNKYMQQFQINTRIRISHFLAQIGHESGDLTQLVERLDLYTSEQLIRLSPFSNHFKSITDTVQFVGNGVALGNLAYGGRSDLGNSPNNNDGYNYRGRGAIQITGKVKYEKTGKQLSLDLVNKPELLEQPDTALLASFYEWNNEQLNPLADKDDVISISKSINLGNPKSQYRPNGLDDRIIRLKKIKKVFGI